MSEPQYDPASQDPREQAILPPHLRGTSPDLRLCLVREGWMLSDVEHLCGIPRTRLVALGGGAQPTVAEIATLTAIVPSWRPVVRMT